MSALAFTVPGEPRGKGRPRIGKIAGHARMIPDGATAAYENLVRLAATEALAGRPPFDCAVSMQVVVRMTPAASASRPKRAAMLSGGTPPTKKPDLDNTIKAILDGLNTVAFRDDVLVTRITAEKRYAEVPGVDIRIEPARAA